MWRAYRVRLKLAQPMAVGPGWRLGFVMLTRLDVPPRTFWGAFTDGLTRCRLAEETGIGPQLSGAHQSNPYLTVGDWVQRNVRFLPGLLTACEGEAELERVVPGYLFGKGMGLNVRANGSEWQSAPSVEEVRNRYVTAHGATALEYTEMRAAAGMLHENERIMPRIRLSDRTLDVWLETALFVEASQAEGVADWIGRCGTAYLRLGRDAASGSGCFQAVQVLPIADQDLPKVSADWNPTNQQVDTWDLEDEQRGPVIRIEARAPEGTALPWPLRLPGPIVFDRLPEDFHGYWGELRPHIVREYDVDQGFGRAVGYAHNRQGRWCLEHGSFLALGEPAAKPFVLGRDGWLPA